MILALHSLQIATVFVLAPMFVIEKHILRQRIEKNFYNIIIVRMILYSAIVTCIMLVCTLFAYKLFNLQYRSDFSDILLLIASFSFAMVSFAQAVSSWAKKATDTITYTLFYIMPSVLFTGAIWPRVSMDSFSYLLSYIMPIAYTANDLRNLLLRGYAPLLHQDIVYLLTFSTICLMLTILGLKYYLHKNASKNNRKEVARHDSCNAA